MCFQSIYKRIRKDFSFLDLYGFQFKCLEHHNIMPSVIFSNGNENLQIGMHFEDKKIFAVWYENSKQIKGVNILEDVALNGNSYKEQIIQVKNILCDYLKLKM